MIIIKSSEHINKYKIATISILITISCFLTYYFHSVQGIGTVFSHFFYIPIILSAIWWKRKSLIVALFLSVILVFSHNFLRAEVVTANDYFRSILLMVIASVVAFLSERIARTEKKLQNTSVYLEKLFNHANAPIIVWDPELKITRFNQSSERLTGYKAKEVIGSKLQMLFPDFTYNDSLAKIIHALNGKYWEAVEIPILRKDGNVRQVIWNSANILAEDNKTITTSIAQGIDITDRKNAEDRLKKSEKMYRNTIEYLPLHIGVTDPDGKYIIWNDYSEKMFGYSSNEAIKGLTLNKLIKESEKTEDIFSCVLKHGVYDEYIDLVHKSGRIIPAQLKVVPVYQSDNKLSSLIVEAEDLTLIESSREKIKILSKEVLESQENERRKLSTEIHDEAGVAITSLQLNCSMIKELISLNRYDKIEQFIDSIVDTSKDLSSELRKVCYNLAPANISQDGVIYAISDYIEKIKAYAELEIDLKISREIENSDIVIKTTLYRTIQEAVTNVIRHSHAKNLMLTITKRKNDINLKIADNGIGFNMDSIAIDKYGLKGIRNRVESLGGDFKICSKPGNGTSIEVHLPYI